MKKIIMLVLILLLLSVSACGERDAEDESGMWEWSDFESLHDDADSACGEHDAEDESGIWEWSDFESLHDDADIAELFVFEENENGLTVIEYIGDDHRVIIPKSYGGVPITEIGSGFSSNENIKSLAVAGSIAVINESAFENCASLKELIILEGTAEIAKNAFRGCNSLKRVRLPNSLNVIGSYAFADCVSLEEINIPRYCFDEESEYIFARSGLSSVQIPAGVTVIPKGMFAYTKITEISLPSTLLSVNESAFEGVPLAKIDINPRLETIGNRAFYGIAAESVSLPDSLVKIGDSAFEDSALKSIGFGRRLKTIGKYAFCNTRLTELTLPETVKTIGRYAFYNTQLTEVTLPESANTFYENSFGGNSRFKRLTYLGRNLPQDFCENDIFGSRRYQVLDELYEIRIDEEKWSKIKPIYVCGHPLIIEGYEKESYEYNGFEYTKRYNTLYNTWSVIIERYIGDETKITVPAYIEGIPVWINESAFRACDIEEVHIECTDIPDRAFEHCTNLKRVTFSDELSYIGNHAFFGCAALDSIKLPDECATIGDYAFAECPLIKDFYWPEKLSSIGAGAFMYCESIESVELKDCMYIVEQYAFYGCGSLKDLSVESPMLESYDNYAFAYTAITEFTPHPELRVISSGLFSHSALEKITLTQNCNDFNSAAFEYTKIKEIIIPATVGSLDFSDAFVGCPEKVRLKFMGDAPSIPDVYDPEEYNVIICYHENRHGFDRYEWKDFEKEIW